MIVDSDAISVLASPGTDVFDRLIKTVQYRLSTESDSRFVDWRKHVLALQPFRGGPPRIVDGRLHVGDSAASCSHREYLISVLKQLCPWRKGPLSISGIEIDTEWRSDLKWNRMASRVGTLNGQRVLDVGCGNGYYGYRMAAAGASSVIGIDPFLLNVVQFSAIDALCQQDVVRVLPLKVEEMPPGLDLFDTVFSMGILYHQKSPIGHLETLKGFLRPGGRLFLETLIVEGNSTDVLFPVDRYAMMRNVWFIPSVPMLVRWLRRVGFVDIDVIDVTPTTLQEQRSTEWMTFSSLGAFLDPVDSHRTVEGYPAPVRAAIVAHR